MEENVLKDFETFDEFPDKYLKVNKSSNYYLINKNGKKFVAKKKLHVVSLEVFSKQKIVCVSKYYDINNEQLIMQTKSISNLDGTNEEHFEIKDVISITALNSVLDLDENAVCYLLKEDVDGLIKESQPKVYKIKPRKEKM